MRGLGAEIMINEIRSPLNIGKVGGEKLSICMHDDHPPDVL